MHHAVATSQHPAHRVHRLATTGLTFAQARSHVVWRPVGACDTTRTDVSQDVGNLQAQHVDAGSDRRNLIALQWRGVSNAILRLMGGKRLNSAPCWRSLSRQWTATSQ